MNKTIRIISILSMISLLSGCKAKETMEIILKEYNEKLSFLTENQEGYFNDDYINIGKYASSGKEDLSKSKAINISWDINTNVEDYTFGFKYKCEGDKEFYIETSETNVDLYNLRLDAEYEYSVDYKFKTNKSAILERGTFKTSDVGLRNLNIETLSNIRDLGGISIGDGKRIKQGLIYRSAAMNEAYTSDITISDNDKNYLVDVLGIKSDVDLRQNVKTSKGIENGELTESPLGKEVTYKMTPMVYGGNNVLTKGDNQSSIRAFFEFISHEENYPMMFHCSQGKDRTGAMAYVIEALLGAEHEDIMRDYLFTNFSNVGSVHRTSMEGDSMVAGTLNNYENGETLKEKTYNYLVNETNIPSETLDRIINILG